MKKIILFISIVFLFSFHLFANERIQSFIKLHQDNVDEKVLEDLFEIADSIYFNNFDEYKSALDDIEKFLDKHDNEYYRYYFYESQLYYYSALEDSLAYKKALNVYNKYFEETQLDSLRGAYYYLNGLYKYRNKKYYDAIDFYEKAIESYQQNGNFDSVAFMLNFIGKIYYDLKVYDKSLLYYLKSVNAYENLNKAEKNIDNYINIALIYQNINNFDSAIKYFEMAYEIALKEQDFASASNLLNYIGITYFDKKNYKKAIEYLEQSLEVGDEYLTNQDKAIKLNNIGLSFMRLDNVDQAEKFLKQALTLYDEKDLFSLANTKLNLAEVYLKQNKISQAEELIDFAFKHLNKKDSLVFYMKALRHKATLNEKKGNFQEAYFAMMEYSKLFREDTENKLNLKVNDIKNQYEIEKKDKEIELLKKTEEISRFELERITYIRNTLVVGSLIILLFLMYIIYKYKQNIELSKLLKKQKEELEQSYKELKLAQENIIELERKNSILAMVVTANHELNQPLMILRSNFDMLNFTAENQWTSEQKKYIEQIEKSLDRINDILRKYRDNQNVHLGEYAGEDQMVIFD